MSSQRIDDLIARRELKLTEEYRLMVKKIRAYLHAEFGESYFDNARDSWNSFFEKTREVFQQEKAQAAEELKLWFEGAGDEMIAFAFFEAQIDELDGNSIVEGAFFELLGGFLGEERANQIFAVYQQMRNESGLRP